MDPAYPNHAGGPARPLARPTVVVVVGLPGSGKTTWLEDRRCPTLSSDHVRELLSDDVTNQSIHRRVFAVVRQLLRQRLELRRPRTFIDATNLTRKERRPYIKLADLYDCDAEALYFDVPLDVCLERNAARDRCVPPSVIADMSRRLEPPAYDEGFSRITVIAAGR